MQYICDRPNPLIESDRNARSVSNSVPQDVGRCQRRAAVLADEIADEKGGTAEARPEGERKPDGFWHGEGQLMGFCHGFATVGAISARFGWPKEDSNVGA